MLKVIQPGYYTSVQDLGRYGYRDIGVPVSGVMDPISAHNVNALLENSENAPLLEITVTGPKLCFTEATALVLGGAEFEVLLNGNPIANYTVYPIAAGDILEYKKLKQGYRGYLGVKGGFLEPEAMGSSSYYLPITERGRLQKDNEVLYEVCSDFAPTIAEMKNNFFWKKGQLEVTPGPEYHILDDAALEQLFFHPFSVAKENNRMAYQLVETLEAPAYPMLTSASIPGTVQLTPAGKLIVLMQDGQTTGGYPRVLQLTDQAKAILAQQKAGDRVSFKLLRQI